MKHAVSWQPSTLPLMEDLSPAFPLMDSQLVLLVVLVGDPSCFVA